MNENYLHILWKTKRLPFHLLKTIDGKDIKILHVGIHNLASGPDFFNGSIEFDGIKQVGNIELHIKSSDWYAHGHQTDPAYDNVILHVVYEHDSLVFIEGFPIPTIELKQHIDWKHFHQFSSVKKQFNFPCQAQIQSISSELFWEQVQLAFEQRAIRKSNDMKELQLTGEVPDLKQMLFISFAKAFGMKTNGMPFVQLANQLPLERFLKATLVEKMALLFGIAGFLEDEIDAYQKSLKQEWEFQKHKYKLEPMRKETWQFKGCRPSGFPTLRLAQFANFAHSFSGFSASLEGLSQAVLKEFLQKMCFELDAYWQKNYDFDKLKQKDSSGSLSKSAAQVILMNALIPFIWEYGKWYSNPKLKEVVLKWMNNSKPENNKIIENWKEFGFNPKSAIEAQGLIEMTNEFCSKKQCLNCSVGKALFNQD